MQPTIIGLIGKPLSGKDTFARELIKQRADVGYISIGETIKEIKAIGSTHRFAPVLSDAIAVADRGGIAPEGPICAVVEQLIQEFLIQGKTTIVWAGGPRNIAELDWLTDWSKDHGLRDRYLLFDISDAEATMRLAYRQEGRADDREDILNTRLAEYHAVTEPVVTKLQQEGRLLSVCGVGERESVMASAMEALRLPAFVPEASLPPMSRR